VLKVALPAIVALLTEAPDGARRRGHTPTPVEAACTMNRTNSSCVRGPHPDTVADQRIVPAAEMIAA
jgi:hypothetical protein